MDSHNVFNFPGGDKPSFNPDAQLIALGWEPIPTIGKAPKNDNWQRGEITVERIAAMRAVLPAATNTGLRTGRAVGLDVDIIDDVQVARIKQIATEVLGYTPLERFGSKGCMLVYRNETPIKKITIAGTNPAGERCKVEILGQGQQFVAYGIHPTTNKPYRWVEPIDEPLYV